VNIVPKVLIKQAEKKLAQVFGPISESKEAQEALLQAAQRYEKTKVMGLSGLGIKAIKNVWEFHDLQRTSIARSEYEKMIKKTADYIRSHGKDVVEVT